MLFKKKNKDEILYSPCKGKTIELKDVPDPVFADKILGDGICIIPDENIIYSPVKGKVTQLFDTLHAYTLRTDSGIDILIHIGLNTVELKGIGFNPFVREGENVNVGDKLVEVDFNLIQEKGYEIYTPVIISDNKDILSIKANYGNKIKGDEILNIKLN